MVLAPELMVDVRMVHHLHAATRIDAVPQAETRTAHVVRMVHRRHEEIRIVVVARKVADQTARRSEVILIVARLANGTAVAIADRADLRTWITNADLQRGVTLNADLVAATQKVVHQKAATSLAKVEDRQHGAAKAAGTLDLRCKAVDHRSRIADPVLAGLRGLNVVSRLVADHRSVRADPADLKWDHRG